MGRYRGWEDAVFDEFDALPNNIDDSEPLRTTLLYSCIGHMFRKRRHDEPTAANSAGSEGRCIAYRPRTS